MGSEIRVGGTRDIIFKRTKNSFLNFNNNYFLYAFCLQLVAMHPFCVDRCGLLLSLDAFSLTVAVMNAPIAMSRRHLSFMARLFYQLYDIAMHLVFKIA